MTQKPITLRAKPLNYRISTCGSALIIFASTIFSENTLTDASSQSAATPIQRSEDSNDCASAWSALKPWTYRKPELRIRYESIVSKRPRRSA
jgi:hypothetical protein